MFHSLWGIFGCFSFSFGVKCFIQEFCRCKEKWQISGMLALHTNWHTDWLCVKNVYFLGWVFGIFTRFRSQYSRRSKEIHCRREELERKLTAFPLYQWKAEEMAHTVWKGPLVGNDMQSRMKCVVWEKKKKGGAWEEAASRVTDPNNLLLPI